MSERITPGPPPKSIAGAERIARPTKNFADCSDQTITVRRPPDDYLVVADTRGRGFVVSKRLLADPTFDVGEFILHEFARLR